MIREIIKTMLQPIKAVWSIFDDDAHKIISKRGIEVLGEQKTKIDIIHDVSDSVCSNCDGYGYTLDENGRRKEHCDKC